MPAPNNRRPAATGHRERAISQIEGQGCVSNVVKARKTDRPTTDERLCKSDAIARERAIIEAREARRKLLPPEVQKSLLLGDQKDRERKLTSRAAFDVNLLRETELTRVFALRYGGKNYVLPDDDSGRDDALLMAHHQVKLSHGRARARNWIAAHCPWMDGEEAARLIARAHAQDWTFVADDLAGRLGLTYDCREALGLTTIGAIDLDKSARAARRRAKDREYQTAKRAAAGATPRKLSLSRTEPWLAEGITRRTWERRRKKAAGDIPGGGRDIAGGPRDASGADRDISGRFRDIANEPGRMSQIRRQQDTKYQLGADAFATPTETGSGLGRALDGAPTLRVARGKAVAFVPSRAGYTHSVATLRKAKGGQQADPFPIFPDTREGQNPPTGMAAWVLPGERGAGARPRETSAFNIFSQGGA